MIFIDIAFYASIIFLFCQFFYHIGKIGKLETENANLKASIDAFEITELSEHSPAELKTISRDGEIE